MWSDPLPPMIRSLRLLSRPCLLSLLLLGCASSDRALYAPIPPARGPRLAAPRITQALIPRGRYGRHRIRGMQPRYITIHSTQNYSTGAGAYAHANLQLRGALRSSHNSLGYLSWHYTVDDHSIYQSLPDNEQGQHADYEGPGNRYSLGIEMCQNRDNSRNRTVDQTARLTAYLMARHNIPLRNVVPHQHWKRIRYDDRQNMGPKDCPNFLLDHGQPGAQWRDFLAKVRTYRAQY